MDPDAAGRVLCFSPYNWWKLHAAWEMTLLRAIQQRGGEVHLVMCDGQMSICDVRARPGNRYPPDLVCQYCQQACAQQAFALGMNPHWLSQWVDDGQKRLISDWAHQLDRDDLLEATYNDWPIARWIISSLHTYFRVNQVDLDDPVIENACRQFIESGSIVASAVERMLEQVQPDVVLAFNGRMAPMRVMLELARARDIRVLVHERGLYRRDALMLTENEPPGLDDGNVQRVRDHWMDVPLTPSELDQTRDHLADREQGSNMSWYAFSPPPGNALAVADQLNLSPARPVWVLFMSSVDELASVLSDRGCAFADPSTWVRQTVAFARKHPEIDLVLRAHPNAKPHPEARWNEQDLALCRELESQLAANMRLVMPDASISSYSLMRLATVSLVYITTAGLEFACQGGTVVVAGPAYYRGLQGVISPDDSDDYHDTLVELLSLRCGQRDPQIMKHAYRCMFGLVYRMDHHFPQVTMVDPTTPRINWHDAEELAPGRCDQLDAICRVVLHGQHPVPLPGEDAMPGQDVLPSAQAPLGQPSPQKESALLNHASPQGQSRAHELETDWIERHFAQLSNWRFSQPDDVMIGEGLR